MTSGPSQRKIGKLIDKFELESLDRQLRFKYNVENDSLRDLANFINVQVTKAYLEDKPFSPQHVYQTLRDPNDTAAQDDQLDLKRRLRLHDVDVDGLEKNWVTHMSVRSYLQKDLDIDTERETKGPLSPSVTMERIRGLLDREEKIIWENFQATEGVDASEWDLHQELRLINRETGESIPLREYLQQIGSELE